MLTIAQCTDSFLPVADGAGRASYAYARALSERGHAVYVITPMVNGFYRGRHPFEILDYMSVKKPWDAQKHVGLAGMDLHYLARADSIKFDLVHTHSPGSAGQEAARLASRLHVPLVGSFHPQYIEEYLGAASGQSVPRSAQLILDYFKRCDEIWTVSEDALALLGELGYTGHVEIMENGTQRFAVSPSDQLAARRRMHLGDEPLLLYAGRVDHAKNLSLLVDAAAALRGRGCDFTLLFAGRGSAEYAIKEYARSKDLQNTLRFTGHIEEDRLLHELYAVAALCIFPATGLSPGLTLREAAAQGTPSLVLAGTTAAACVRDGENGLVSEPDAEAMAARIAAFLDDPGAKARLGREARVSLPVEWDAVIGRAEERYEALAARDRAQLTRKRGVLFRKELEQADRTLNKRVLDLIWRFLMQDTQRLYSYPRRVEKRLMLPVADRAPLPRSSPEEQGVSSRDMLMLIDQLNAEDDIGAQVFMALRHGCVIAEAQWSPYEAALPHEVYSLSKSITATAVGMLYDEGLLSLDEKLADLFPDKMPEDEAHPSQRLTVRHLLCMSTGSLFNELGSALGADWESEFLHAGTRFEPGTRFLYNSLNTYMLASIVYRKTGQTLTEYLGPRLYEPLGIDAHDWELAPTGIEKGGWGLNLTAESVAKIGLLYLNRGVWHMPDGDKRLLSEAWVDAATSLQIDTPEAAITNGYGYQIWMTAHEGAFLFNGVFGQYMLAIPEWDALFVLFSGSPHLFAAGGLLDIVDKAFARVSSRPLPEDPAARKALAATSQSLSVRYRRSFYEPDWIGASFPRLVEHLDGLVYHFDENRASLFPVLLMSVHNNYSTGVERIAFRAEGDALIVSFVEGEARHDLCLRAGGYAESQLAMQGDSYAARTDLQARTVGTDEWRLRLNIHFIETPYTRLVELRLSEGTLTAVFDEYPSLSHMGSMYAELKGSSRTQLMRQLMPLVKQERSQARMRGFGATSIQGRL